MRDGTQIDVDEMSIEHLRNTLKMLIRNKQRKAAAEMAEFLASGEMSPKFERQENVGRKEK